MKSIELTYDEALSLLNQAVDEKGSDYRYYGSCVYFEEDAPDPKTAAPSCIVGHVLWYRGITLEDISWETRWEDEPASYNVEHSVDDLIAEGVINCDSKTQMLLAATQGKQDAHVPWGVAVNEAVQEVNDEINNNEESDE